MALFANNRTADLYYDGYHAQIPKHVGRRAHTILHLVVSATELRDIEFIARGEVLIDGGRHAVQVDGKWHVTFDWEPVSGGTNIKVERL
jgi:plasmid maintenance system killer protein